MPISVKSPIHKDPISFAYTANFDKEISVCVFVHYYVQGQGAFSSYVAFWNESVVTVKLTTLQSFLAPFRFTVVGV